ncbi:MAG: DUF3137 domain-containing protein [Demequinaceae bacterium]|nr:DUF3137 domain-containing protein [Demequinaceae bacterium]
MTDTGSPADFIAGLVGFVVIGGGVWYLVGLAERRRHERNRRYAVHMGWEYLVSDPSLIEAFESPPFGQGRRKKATDAMRGTVRGREFIVFGYRYVTGSGKNQKVHDVRACVVRVSGHIPLVRISPEHVGTRILAAFGADDVEVESDEFNRRWFVASRDQRAAHALLSPRMIERFLEYDLNGKTAIFEPGNLIMCDRGRLDLPATPLPFDTLCDLAELVPDFLAQDYP